MAFEERLKRLEEIATLLDGGAVELAAALELFAEAVEIIRVAAAELREAEGTVKLLVQKLDGTFELKDIPS